MDVNTKHMVHKINQILTKTGQFLHGNAARLFLYLTKILRSLKYLDLAEFRPKL